MLSVDTDTLFDDMENLIMAGNNDELKSMLSADESLLHIKDSAHQTLLHIAAKHNNLEIAEYLTSMECDVDAKDIYGWTPIMIATAHIDHKITELLLKADANVFTNNSYGRNALGMFLSESPVRPSYILNLFIEKVKDRGKSKERILRILERAGAPLDTIVHFQDAKVVQLFLEQHDSINGKVLVRSIYNCMVSFYKDNLKALLKYGTDLERKMMIFLTMLEKIVRGNGSLATRITVMSIQLLLELKSLNERTAKFVDVLYMYAAEQSFRVLTRSDLSSYIESELGYNPNVYIFANSRQSVFDFIKSNVDYINAIGRSNITALHVASSKGIATYVKYLLEMGADPNAVTDSGLSPIFFTHEDENRKKRCLKLLLQYGADIQVSTDLGRFVFEYIGCIDKYKDTFIVLLNHLALLKIQGAPIKEEFIAYVTSNSKLIQYYNDSLKQLETMKSHNVCGTLSLFKVFTKSIDFTSRRVTSLDEESLKALFQSQEMQSYDRYYIEILYKRILKAWMICRLRKKAETFLYENIETLSYYSVVIEKICSFLTHDELRVFATV